MTRPLLAAGFIALLIFLNFQVFPGHTWLQSDTQIYVPILEHRWDPQTLAQDLIPKYPHVSLTLYDETALLLRKMTGLEFRCVLTIEQIVFRALGIYGFYLLAGAAGLPMSASLLVAALMSLGATIVGPSVLTFEYEPVPRGFAMALIFLALGLTARGRLMGASIAASLATLYHAPTTIPFWVIFFVCLFRRPQGRLGALLPLAAAAALIATSAWLGPSGDAQVFFSRIDPALEQIQRSRASYNWVSMWNSRLIAQYVLLWIFSIAAIARTWRATSFELRVAAIGLPLIGILSPLASYLLLEKAKWALIPQIQPMRALLFITLMAALLGMLAAWRALQAGRVLEALAWMVPACLIPVHPAILQTPSPERLLVATAVLVLTTLSLWAVARCRQWAPFAIALVGLAPFFSIPKLAGVRNYAALHTPELTQLADWARASTPRDAVFLFPAVGQDLAPGIFRARSLRAVYVDYKTGGQSNYSAAIAEEWKRRWKLMTPEPAVASDFARYVSHGVTHIVVAPRRRIPGMEPLFENFRYLVYSTSPERGIPGAGTALLPPGDRHDVAIAGSSSARTTKRSGAGPT